MAVLSIKSFRLFVTNALYVRQVRAVHRYIISLKKKEVKMKLECLCITEELSAKAFLLTILDFQNIISLLPRRFCTSRCLCSPILLAAPSISIMSSFIESLQRIFGLPGRLLLSIFSVRTALVMSLLPLMTWLKVFS